MITDIFTAPFNKYKFQDRVELQEIQSPSPCEKKRPQTASTINASKLRIQKIQTLSKEVLDIRKRLTEKLFKNEIESIQNPEFCSVKNTKHLFYGMTSITQNEHNFFKNNYKIAEGLCEIFYDIGSYLIGYFDKGILQTQFIYILPNGDYLKAQEKISSPKKEIGGFRTEDDSDQIQYDSSNSSDSEGIDSSQIKITVFHELKSSEELQCQMSYNNVYYKGTLKDGYLHNKVTQVSPNYKFEGIYYKGERKRGKLTSSDPHFGYDGTFKFNKFDGLGTLKTSQGYYKGQFKDGYKDGQGCFTWFDKSFYQGNFKKDRRHGKGLYKSQKGSFKGEWKDDKIEGSGYMIVGGKGIGGEWKNNQYQSPTKFY